MLISVNIRDIIIMTDGEVMCKNYSKMVLKAKNDVIIINQFLPSV